MSGILALLDDVAAIAKLAASSLDDIAAQTIKAGSKSAGVVIDDAAVTPKYVTGLPAAREIPIVAKIARGSLFNKFVILLPALLLLEALAPWAITPLLLVGGAYLCFEGAEKIWHAISGHHDPGPQQASTLDAAHLEQQRVKGAIKTDFILSAEIMTITLASIDAENFWMKLVVLAIVAFLITVVVYGAVALIVKLDDIGLKLSRSGSFEATRAFGRNLVSAMPTILKVISTVGTAAMLWVGGSIIVHGLNDLGVQWPYETIKSIAYAASSSGAFGFVNWLITALIDGIIGLALGLVLIPIVESTLSRFETLFPEKQATAASGSDI
jgi:predicted DNA repair protein MutK